MGLLWFALGIAFGLVARKLITKQPLLKARVDSWVDTTAAKLKD